MKDINYYLSLPYTIELLREDETTWFARVRELPGCMTEGDSPAEAAEMIQDAMQGWLEVSLEDGDSIPEPRPEADYSGKFVVRVSRSLHRDLVETADREGVSLNQYIATELARSVGRSLTTATLEPNPVAAVAALAPNDPVVPRIVRRSPRRESQTPDLISSRKGAPDSP